MSRYPDADWQTRQMLLRIEADHPDMVAAYLNHVGLTELPLPNLKPGDVRKYQTWELWDDLEFGKQYWYRTDVPADKSGYVSAMTRRHRFDAEEPVLPNAKKAKRNDN